MSQPPHPPDASAPPPVPPSDPYGQQPGFSQPAYPAYPAYPQYMPRKPTDWAQVVFIGAWVVLSLHALTFFYFLTVDGPVYFMVGEAVRHEEAGFADRFFGGMPTLALGLFLAAAMIVFSKWIRKQQQEELLRQQSGV